MKFTNPNFESHPRYLGKTQPPANYVVAQTAIRHLVFTDIPVKQVLVDWTWRNGHAHPIFEHFIPDKPEFIFRDKCLAAYYVRLENVDQIESAKKQLPLLCQERIANKCGCSHRKGLNRMIRSCATRLGMNVPTVQDEFHEFVKKHVNF